MSHQRYICIHGHFYQPPRENPWLEFVEIQDSAYPFHDWNERITAECYGQNAASRMLDHAGNITDIVNNYSQMSFNFGPTLLSWLEVNEPETYQAILQADRESRERFSGHGSAMAQVYGHLIMPLANQQDKITQVLWGIRDFEHRFGRKPEGMWLAEAAVDTETLEVLAEYGLKFTLLAPRQAKSVRKLGSQHWQDVSHERVDPRVPYRCKLPSGRHIDLFFYDGFISQDVAFKGLLKNGKDFAHRFMEAFRPEEAPQLVHIATDGESYGHHHRFGDMALAYCLHHIESQGLAKITNYGEFLTKFPPTHEVQIFENSSWSCVHGVERWRHDCGCNTGGNGGWNQRWRQPLRESLDWLREKLIGVYEKGMEPFTADPWKLRNEYINVLLDRTPQHVRQFLQKHAQRTLTREEQVQMLKLLGMQRHAMQMYTSCGWFFDEVSGIETIQILQYASRTIQLAIEVAGTQAGSTHLVDGIELEETFVQKLQGVSSNQIEFGNAAVLYRKKVKPARLDQVRMGAHYAIASLFEAHPENVPVMGYLFRHDAYERLEAGIQKLVTGMSRVESTITLEESEISYAVLYLGQHTIIAQARENMTAETFNRVQGQLRNAFLHSDIAEAIRLMDEYFGLPRYSLTQLTKDAQRTVIAQIMQETMQDIESSYRQVYRHHYHMMNLMSRTEAPVPGVFKGTVEFILNADLRLIFAPDQPQVEDLIRLADEARRWDIHLQSEMNSYLVTKRLNALVNAWGKAPSVNQLNYMVKLLIALKAIGLRFDPWKAQNEFFITCNRYFGEIRDRANRGEAMAGQWIKYFLELGELLDVKVA